MAKNSYIRNTILIGIIFVLVGYIVKTFIDYTNNYPMVVVMIYFSIIIIVACLIVFLGGDIQEKIRKQPNIHTGKGKRKR